MLLLVPQGCNEATAAKLVANWAKVNLEPPATYANHFPVIVRTSSDSVMSSEQFAKKVATLLSKAVNFTLETDSDDYPSDVLRAGIEGALGAGAYPVLVIERFHAFASIRDGGMGSVLAMMRGLEHGGEMTTLALSPVTYEVIRRSMDAQQPFLNSVYGDNHDQAVMPPLSRKEFVAAAERRGISGERANRLYARGGGPDAVYMALLDLADEEDHRIVAGCLRRAGYAIDAFLQRSFPEAGGASKELLSRLAIGQLTEAEAQFLLSNPFASFICQKRKNGSITCSSPIIAKRILERSTPSWQAYDHCLAAYAVSDFPAAGEHVKVLTGDGPRLAAFRELVHLKVAVSPEPGRGLLGIDWSGAAQAARQLLAMKITASKPYYGWIERFARWAELVQRSAQRAGGRLQLDKLTPLAADPDTRACLLFMIKSHTDTVRTLPKPADRISHLVNIPEAILQSLAAGFCGIDYAHPPEQPPPAEYDKFFGNLGTFEYPPSGSKLTLATLLVVVPAILASHRKGETGAFSDPARVCSLQQRLVTQLRNPAAHTLVAFNDTDATLLITLCDEWLNTWAALDGLSDASQVGGLADSPTAEALADLLYAVDDEI